MSRSTFYNPFIYIAGEKALISGVLIILVTSFVCFVSGTHYLGVVSIRFAKDTYFYFYLLENLINWLVLSVLLYIAGLLLSKSRIRIIDVFGTLAVAKFPLAVVPLLRLIPAFKTFAANSFSLYFLIAVHILAFIYTIVLIYNAYRISCNLKGEKLIISLIVVLFFGEILSQVAIFYIYKL